MRKYIAVGIALGKPTLERVDRLAATTGVTRNALFRKLVDTALPHAEASITPNIGRLVTLNEHQTLLLDALARQLIPDHADRLARTALDLVKKHHGA